MTSPRVNLLSEYAAALNGPNEEERLPPHSLEAERGVLGCILLSPTENLPECLSKLRGGRDVFYDLRNRGIFDALVAQREQEQAIDPITVQQFLRDRDQLDAIGGLSYLTSLPDAVPSAANLEYYIDIVNEKWHARAAITAAIDMVNAIYESRALPSSVVAIAADALERLSSGSGVLPKPLAWDDLQKCVDYSENLLGDRWLELGQGAILFGPSGSGKSVAAVQADIEWAAGLSGLHIKPVRPLKIVVIQTEDSRNDLRESLAGILGSSIFGPEELALVRKNLVILPPVAGGSGQYLANLIDAAAREHRPDMVTVNPLLAFCPNDPVRELGALLYNVIDPVIKKNRIGFLGVHHTPKTNNRDTSGYGDHDFQYGAAGDARVANWPRAMIGIEPVGNGVYRFRAVKRWQRTGWACEGQPTKERFLRHHESAIRWVDCTSQEVAQANPGEDYHQLLDVLPNGDSGGISRERVRHLAKTKLPGQPGKNKADGWLKMLVEDDLVERVESETQSKRKEALFRRR